MKGRIIPIEYHINTPFGGEQTVEPMYQQIKTLSEEFTGPPGSNSFMHSASLSYSFNRSLPGYTPMPEFVKPYSESAEEFITKANLDESAPVSVSINKIWNENSKSVSGEITIVFDEAVQEGDYRVGLFIVEHSVTGPIPNYRQYSDLAFPDAYDDNYEFPDVLRDEVIAGSIWGGKFTTDPAILINHEYRKSFSYTLPDLYYDIEPKSNNIELIAFVCRYDEPINSDDDPSGEILNSCMVKMTPKDTPVKEFKNSNKILLKKIVDIKNDFLNINLDSYKENDEISVELLNGLGKKILSKKTISSTTIDISNIPNGFLFVKIIGKEINRFEKILKN